MRNFHVLAATCLSLLLITSSVAEAATIVFVNPCSGGCQFSPGPDNAVENTSTLINSTSNLSAFAADNATFNAVRACLTGLLTPFDIVVTVSDPSPTPHTELVLAGTPGQLLLPSGITAVAPFTCNLVPNAPAFVFANAMGSDVELMCNTAAAQLGAMAGLEPLYNCQDVMSYLPGCGSKSFRNEASMCGTSQAAACICGGTTRNSFATMKTVFGTSGPLFMDGFENLP